jgi:SAM-dependent methyltransferase
MFSSFLDKIYKNTILILINLKVKLFTLFEYSRVLITYYPRNFEFFKIDTYLLGSYLFSNPFTVSKEYLVSQGEEDIYAYGETPLTTLDQITQKCQLSSEDIVYELGCGRGRTCFWLHQFIGCSVIGIDYVPLFIEKANQIKNHFHLSRIDFRLENFLESDFKTATVIYLYGTCLPTPVIYSLIQRFSALPLGTKVITVSYALTDYAIDSEFEVIEHFLARFTWGVTDVYVHIKKK